MFRQYHFLQYRMQVQMFGEDLLFVLSSLPPSHPEAEILLHSSACTGDYVIISGMSQMIKGDFSVHMTCMQSNKITYTLKSTKEALNHLRCSVADDVIMWSCTFRISATECICNGHAICILTWISSHCNF